jgi:Phosphate transporter family
LLGVPVSTTHTITGAIIGVGSARRLSAVRWGVAGDIVIAWIVTMPAAALVTALFYGVSLVWCVPCGFCGGMLPTEPALDAIWLKGDPAGSGRL